MDALPPVVPFYHIAPVQKINGVTVLPAPNWYPALGKRADPLPPARPFLADYRVTTVKPVLVAISPMGSQPIPVIVAYPSAISELATLPVVVVKSKTPVVYRKLNRK